MSEMAQGFRRRRFCDLPDRDKRDILKLMARIAEQAYRRSVQQGAGLAGKPSFRGDLWEWRYRPSLDLSPWIDRPTTTTSLDRLDTECGEPLRELGFAKSDGDADWWRPGWHARPWRSVWTGYTPEQRRLIRAGNRPTAVSHKGAGVSDGAL